MKKSVSGNPAEKLDEIKASLKDYDYEKMLDLTAYLIYSYVINESASLNNINNIPQKNSPVSTEFSSFAHFMEYAKENFSFSELDNFNIEGEEVYVQVNNGNFPVLGKTKNSKSERKNEEVCDNPKTNARFQNLEID